MKERAILVTLDFDLIRRESSSEDLAKELEDLSKASGASVIGNLIVHQKTPNAALLVGKGKAEEFQKLCEAEEADLVIFNSDLSASQQRNLEDLMGVKTIDRTQLILDIFALRAKSAEGKLQVELAQLQYLLPRLTGKGIFLSRLGGGIGTRGPGEQKLEIDRRRIRARIARLSDDLACLQKRRLAAVLRKKEKDLPIVALVGYTHAGKSTLFNYLTGASVPVRHQLFSTLDTTTRLHVLSSGRKILLVDTVGFIRELPHHLIEAFKATLEEAIHADLLLCVMDASREDHEMIRRAVESVLFLLGVDPQKSLMVFNKLDGLSETRKKLLTQDRNDQTEPVFVSGKTGEGTESLRLKLEQRLFGDVCSKSFFIPKKRWSLLPPLYESGSVVERKDLTGGCIITVRMHVARLKAFERVLKERGRHSSE